MKMMMLTHQSIKKAAGQRRQAESISANLTTQKSSRDLETCRARYNVCLCASALFRFRTTYSDRNWL